MLDRFVLHGDIVHTPTPNVLSITENGYLLCENGLSEGVYSKLPDEYASCPMHDYSGCLIIPGMNDTHVHASQYAFRGLGMDMELIDWLNANAFPEEIKYNDSEYAAASYKMFVDALKASPTTRACVFATTSGEAAVTLMRLMDEAGLRGYVGKVSITEINFERSKKGCHSFSSKTRRKLFGLRRKSNII